MGETFRRWLTRRKPGGRPTGAQVVPKWARKVCSVSSTKTMARPARRAPFGPGARPGSRPSAFYQGGSVGVTFALDQHSGQIKGQLDTVDSADIWGNPQVNSGAGARFPPGIDTDTGTTYWGTGNSAPVSGAPGFPSGPSRPGPNLYTVSLLALDHASGRLDWYHADTRFDTATLTVPAHTRITVNYTNDSPLRHNIHFHAGGDARAPSPGETPIAAGPGAVTAVSFTTPGPGTYFYWCDVHTTRMTGHLVVQ
jgi:plastocyanin